MPDPACGGRYQDFWIPHLHILQVEATPRVDAGRQRTVQPAEDLYPDTEGASGGLQERTEGTPDTSSCEADEKLW